MTWDELDYWKSGEWQVVQEKLDGLDKQGRLYLPQRQHIFRALDATPMASVRVAIIGQDPYPSLRHATGIAFSIPKGESDYPPTLRNIYSEYCSDLHYPYPSSGSLEKWVKQGVLLWNAIPTCNVGESASHHWDEWTFLTKEIVERLDQQDTPVVFILLGNYARNYSRYIRESDVIEASHPSPLGAKWSFFGSRIFSTANGKLVEAGVEPINWRLDHGERRDSDSL